METKQRLLMGLVLLAAIAGASGWYFWCLYVPPVKHIAVREKTLTPHDELFDVHMNESGRGWVVGKYGLVLRTDNGGESWGAQRAGTKQTLTAVSFADDRHGFVIGSGGTILATKDGGLSWAAQNSGTGNHLLGVHASSPTHAYVVGAFGTVLSTSNGGAAWRTHHVLWKRLISSLIEQVGDVEPDLNAVYFVKPEVGWVVGEFGLVLHTGDGGQTWTVQGSGKDLPALVAIKFHDERTGFAVGQQGAMVKTTDGGRNWEELRLGTKGFYGISLYGKHGAIVGDGIVLKTENHGADWLPVESFPRHLWLSGVAVKGKIAIAVGQAGTLLRFDP